MSTAACGRSEAARHALRESDGGNQRKHRRKHERDALGTQPCGFDETTRRRGRVAADLVPDLGVIAREGR